MSANQKPSSSSGPKKTPTPTSRMNSSSRLSEANGSRKQSVVASQSGSRKQSVAQPKSAAPEPPVQTEEVEKEKEKERAPRGVHVVPPGMEEYTQCCPPGLYRMFFTGATQNQFNIRSEEDITQEDNIRTINRTEILEDIYKKNVGSDFSAVRKLVEDYPEEDILVIYDYDFQFDKNYYLCLDLGLKEIILDPPIVLPPDPVREPPKYVPPTSKPWVSLGSELEIDEENFSYRRPLLKYTVNVLVESLKRKSNFGDEESSKHQITINSYEEQGFSTKMIEFEKAVQAAPNFCEQSAQTVWRYPKNATTQYQPRYLNEAEKQKCMTDPNLALFAQDAFPLFESALQQNQIFDSFENDWQLLGAEMSSIGGPGEVNLKEYQSFSDIHHSKNKLVTCVQWHPTLKGIVGMSLANNFSVYERIENLSKSIISSSLILIWSFVDPIQPKLLLEAPDDVTSFAFSPTEPNIIAGGCHNGQVALWDIAQWEDRIINPRSDHRDKDLFLPGFEDESYFQTPLIRYCALSSLEHSHSTPITELIWIPSHFEIDKLGFPTESAPDSVNSQLMTAGLDSQILFWDTRSKSVINKKNEKADPLPMNVPDTFKHLTSWRPLLKVTLPCSDPGGDFAPRKFSITERQGDKSTIELEDKLAINAESGNAYSGKPGSGKSRLLQHLNTHIVVGTEDGQYVYVDWVPQKEADSSKLITSKAEWYSSVVDGPVVATKRSPFFKDILLIAGGTQFNIWREKVNSGALLQTRSFSKHITDAEWSPSRPGVFFIANQDGSVDIWDLLDKTHAPILTQPVSINKLSYICCSIVSPRQQLIGIGDSMGTLHILEVPWSLRRNITGELQAVKAYLTRETDRREYVKKRWEFRDEEKRENERILALKAGVGPPHIPTEDEIKFRLKEEFQSYLHFEASILRELGLRDDDDSPNA